MTTYTDIDAANARIEELERLLDRLLDDFHLIDYEYEPVGSVAVDSGQVTITDPAARVEDLEVSPSESGAATLTNDFGVPVGVNVATAFGDGRYTVYSVISRDQRVGAFIDFTEFGGQSQLPLNIQQR